MDTVSYYSSPSRPPSPSSLSLSLFLSLSFSLLSLGLSLSHSVLKVVFVIKAPRAAQLPQFLPSDRCQYHTSAKH